MPDVSPLPALPLEPGTAAAPRSSAAPDPADVLVFDPAMCCSTGVCGPSIDPTLLRVSADLGWLSKQGVSVERVNLGQEPLRFVETPAVSELLDGAGEAALPVVMIGGEVVATGRYPTRQELAATLGLTL